MNLSKCLIALSPAMLAAHAHAQLVVSPAGGMAPVVQVYDSAGTPTRTFTAFDASFHGGVRVAAGDLNGDGVPDIIVSAGPGGGPHVKIFDGASGGALRTLTPFGNNYTGTTFVAAGVLLGDTTPDVVVSASTAPTDGGGHVRVFDGRTGWMLYSLNPFPGFAGGVRVATADLDGDGFDDVIAAPDHTHPNPSIKVICGRTLIETQNIPLPGGDGDDILIGGITGYDREGGRAGTVLVGMGDGSVRFIRNSIDVGTWRPFGTGYNGGLSIATGDINADGLTDIVAGTLVGGRVTGITVDTMDPMMPVLEPFGPGFTGGVFVAASSGRRCPTADFNNDGDLGTDADIEAFFACLAGQCCNACGTADFDRDGDVGTDADIESFFRVLAGGGC